MRKLLILAVAVLGVSLAGAKDSPADLDKRAERMTKKMTEKLKLTDEQQVKVKALNLDMLTKTKAAKDKVGDKETKRAEMKTIRDNYNAEMKKVLTDDQYVKFEKDMKKRHKRQMKKRKHKDIELQEDQQDDGDE